MPSERRQAPDEASWQDRPVLAGALRCLAFAVPLLASIAAASVVARLLRHPEGAGQHVLWWGGVLASSGLVLVVFDRGARRLLPLAALLKLSLVFPDRAPSRMGVALRSGSTKRLQARQVEALRRGDQKPAEAASTILSLAASLNSHDRGTRGHSERVRAYADLIGAELGLQAADRDRLRWAALLHDLGKLTISPGTLNSHHALSADDWEALRRHPLEGARLAAPLREWLGPWALAIEQHHERYDGSGYPYGLAGDQLSLAARIVAVADSYDAMTAPRSYSRGISAAAARRELADKAGTDFDPLVVRAFLSVSLGRVRWVMGPLAFFSALPFAPAASGLRRTLDEAGRTAALGTASLAAAVGVAQPAVQPVPSDPPPAAVAPPERSRQVAPAALVPDAAGAPAAVEAPPADLASDGAVQSPQPLFSDGMVVEGPVVQPGRAVVPAPATPASATPAPATATTTLPPSESIDSTPEPSAPPSEPEPPASDPECRGKGTGPEVAARPCQPPRWGQIEGGNPRAQEPGDNNGNN